MVICAEAFAEKLKEKEVVFNSDDLQDGGSVVFMRFGSYAPAFFFSEGDGRYVSMRIDFEKCSDEKVPDLLVVCNSLNLKYKWLKFCVSEENSIRIMNDAIVDPDTAGDECLELLARTLSILEDAKPLIMRTIYA